MSATPAELPLPSTRMEAVRVVFKDDNPPPAEWIRGDCPLCGQPLVSNYYYVSGKGPLVVWDCWASLEPRPTCSYRKGL